MERPDGAEQYDVVAGIDHPVSAQSNHAALPSISGLPDADECQLTSKNLSGRFEAKMPDVVFWLSDRMFTAKPGACEKVA